MNYDDMLKSLRQIEDALIMHVEDRAGSNGSKEALATCQELIEAVAWKSDLQRYGYADD